MLGLIRGSKVPARGGDSFAAYHRRRQLEERISTLADAVAGKPFIPRGDLLALALAGTTSAGARHALVRAVLRGHGLNPKQLRHKPGIPR
jgi:hypothetical protein